MKANAFKASTFSVDKSTVISWTVEAVAQAEAAQGTLVLLGEDGPDVGTELLIDGETYTVTNVSPSRQGIKRTVTVLCRDGLYRMYQITALRNYIWFSAPKRIFNPAYLDSFKEPFLTDFRGKEGDYFGTSGYWMSDIVAECAVMLGSPIHYALPDFQVKQLELRRGESIVEFLQGSLAPMMPRFVYKAGTLHILPVTASTGSASAPLTSIEAIATSTTYVMPYLHFRVNGGAAIFRTDKWQGKELEDKKSTTLKFRMTSGVTDLEAKVDIYGVRTYYSATFDGVIQSITEDSYAMNAFGEDAYQVFTQTWRFNRKTPKTMTTAAERDAFLAAGYLEKNTSVKPTIPDPKDYWLKDCVRTVNVYHCGTLEWESPLLVEKHTSTWQYLWWASASAGTGDTKNPPDPSETEGDSSEISTTEIFTKYPKTVTPISLVVGDDRVSGIVGVWSTDGRYEVTKYTYENMVGAEVDKDKRGEVIDYVGGMLLRSESVTTGLVRPVLNTIGTNKEETFYAKDVTAIDHRIIPADSLDPQNVGDEQGFYSKVMHVIATRSDTYSEVSIRVVNHTVVTSNMERFTQQLYDEKTGAATGTLGQILGNYRVSVTHEALPLTQAPQSICHRRAMQCYEEGDGDGDRVIEVSAPLIVSWDDIARVAATIRAAHPSFSQITTCNVTIPQKVSVKACMGETISTIYGTGRVVAGSYSIDSDGGISTQLAIQWEATA